MITEQQIIQLAEEHGLLTMVEGRPIWFDGDLTEFARAIERASRPQEVYTVRRESNYRLEVDCFASFDLAREWAAHVGVDVETEPVLDAEDIKAMKGDEA